MTAVVLARWLLSLDSGDAEARRLLGAVQRAADSLNWKQTQRAALITLTLILTTLGVGPALGRSVGEFGALLPLGVGIGALCSLGVGQLALQLVTRGSARTAAAARGPLGHALSVGLRTGTSVALLAEGVSLMLSTAALLPAIFVQDLTVQTSGLGPSQGFTEVKLLAAGLGLGALGPALFGQASGGALYCAGQAGRREPLLHNPVFSYQLNVKNPTLVLDVVAAHVGKSAVRAQLVFCASLLANTAAVSSVLLLLQNGSQVQHPLMLLSLPLVIRGTGLVSSTVTALSTHADESEDILAALFRGQVATSVLCLAAVFGATAWLLGAEEQLPFFLVGGLSVAAGLLVSYGAKSSMQQRASRVRELSETAELSPPLGLARSVAAGLRGGTWPAAGLLVSVGLGWAVGVNAYPATGGALGVALALAGFFSGSCFSAALLIFDAVVESACGLASLDASHAQPDCQGRVAALSASALAAGGVARAYYATAVALVGVSVATTIWRSHTGTPQSVGNTQSVDPMLALGGLTGLALVVGYCGTVLQHVSSTAAGLKTELQRQLRGFVRNATGTSVLPPDFKPRYRDYLDKATAGALQRIPLWSALVLLGPVVLALLARVWSTSLEGQTSPMLVPAFSAFVAVATLVGLTVTLVSDGAASAWNAAVRSGRPKPAAQSGASNLIDTTVDFIGATASSAQLVIAGAAASGLFITAILF